MAKKGGQPIDLKEFETKVVLRQLAPPDYEALVALQSRCFPGMPTWTREQFESQVSVFSQGQIGVFLEDRLVGSSSSLVVDFDRYGEWHNWRGISDNGFIRNHDPAGDTLYGIEMMVDPEFRGLRLARRMYDARKEVARKMKLQRIVIAGRIPGFAEHADKMDVHEYIDKVQSKQLFDTVLTTQLSNGFQLKGLIPDYLTTDKESRGYATHLEWVNLDGARDAAAEQPRRVVRLCLVQYGMRRIGSFEDMAQQCEFFVDVAADYRADFVVFPELFSTQLLSLTPPERPGLAARRLSKFVPRILEMFTRLAVRFNVNILGGSHFAEEGGRLLNIAYLFRRDGTIASQAKLHVTPNERRWWGVEPGNGFEVIPTDCGPVAINVCYDIEFPELGRLATARGANIIFVPFNTDERYGYLRIRHCAQARAIENQVYVAIAGCVGNLPQVHNADIHYAQCAVLTPSDFSFARDAIASESVPNIETVVIHDVNVSLLHENRENGTVRPWSDRRTDMYKIRFTVNGGEPSEV